MDSAATDAPVEERHRRAAALAVCIAGTEVDIWASTGDEEALEPYFSEYKRIEARLVSKYIANAERDGRASRDAEVKELKEALRSIINNGDERMTWARSRGFDLTTIRGLIADLEGERISFGYMVEQLRLLAYASRDAEVAELQGLKPELPPRPPDGEGLPRYGLRWNGPSQPLAVPMADGYWTPFHLASAEVAELQAYKRAWERFIGDGLDGWPDLSIDQAQAALAEERARKETP